ncbi:MAG: SUF system NifU family Fe-S cluster assembly protein [Thaumarchaeota archaeon]|jgi:nitrogen fixation NifU-like protein|uniref:NifU-like protein n=1 Tax=Nitrosotalea sinensis TaxID=1499975 RepID=A0A2H1EJE7_9ARCH|nr:SUF system NifU family Fe-S cluster assembly protein [Candidatus Nitrosotalea sinensis]MDE1724749.1 SUF system NifU family Fe-S cluster assembly protein [Nitrososphaerota archaeon]SHO48066.1 NifU-like protein [Candidatus Nitrosotalea sinensis]
MSSADIYREIILDYYRNPRNYGKISDPDIAQRDSNPLCGDELEMHLNIKDDKVADVKFTGKGCAISQASASMLTELIMGKDFEYVKKLTKEDILDNLGLHDLGPARIKCALLSLKVLKSGLYSYLVDKLKDTASADKIKEEASGLY